MPVTGEVEWDAAWMECCTVGGSAWHGEGQGTVGEGHEAWQSGAGGCEFEERGRAGALCW
jgi:hypothetical protein